MKITTKIENRSVFFKKITNKIEKFLKKCDFFDFYIINIIVLYKLIIFYIYQYIDIKNS
jgi:hypothetical protein